MHAKAFALAAVLVFITACSANNEKITWNFVDTLSENRPRYREDAHLVRVSLNRLILLGGLTGKP
jgi:hypothetical protein